MNDNIKEQLQQLLAEQQHCLCGFRESCEICSSFSAYNQLIQNIHEIINGPPEKIDYGRVITVTEKDLGLD